MRSIKFRQPMYKNEEFYGWHYWGFIDNEFINPYDISGVREESFQFIGFLDCDKKEIYESDIVIFDQSDIGGERVEGEVIWCDDQTLGCLGWGLWTKRGYMHTNFLGSIKIVGNIVENKRS